MGEKETKTENFTYVLRCGDNSLYTGWTNDLVKRVTAHRSGRGAKYTRAHGPVHLVYFEVFSDRSSAEKREAAIKKLKKAEKEALIENFTMPERFSGLST